MAAHRKFPVVSRRGLFQSFQQSVAASRLWRPGEKLLVGVSGGPDSVALLHLLCATGHRPVVAHVNHRLRGSQSDRDERFVHDLCARWGLEFEGVRVSTRIEARKRGESIEEGARRLRYDFFRQVARERRIKKILVAHNRNDQAETLLMRLLRGSGRRGLGGMKIISILPLARTSGSTPLLVRPLLRISRGELLAYLRQNEIPFRRDATNDQEHFFRNRIRIRLIPLIEKHFQPAAVEVFARTAEILADEDGILDRSVPRFGCASRLSRAKLLKLPEGLRGRALSRWLVTRGCAVPSWERIDAVMRVLAGDARGLRRIQLSGRNAVAIRNGTLEIE